MSFDLVIFDCDGVLVDSEIITNRVFSEMLGELGARVTLDEMFERFVGHSMAHCLLLVREMLGRDPPPDFEAAYRRRSGEALIAELKPVPGIVEALEQINIPYCVASNGNHAKMRATLGVTGLLDRFEGRLFSATQVERGKPAPDVFLLAAAEMGVQPDRVVVVEDTPPGIVAGRAAGMMVFGYAGRIAARRLWEAGASRVFEDMRELPGLVNGIAELPDVAESELRRR